MEVIKSNKGGNKICWRGYTYIMKHQGRKRLTWRCTKERSLKCRGTMYTDLQIGHPQIGKVHSHIADKHEVNAIKCIYKLKEAAKQTKTNPAEIYAENVKTLDAQSQA
ncbi:unnamed protein product [Macrosiphum euphorbiae]|uniref:FLYWCH-type domain-containing protein n=1 Tax=Macrosiphum euphorbiae TaxID=13131 RepID=A0AAV0WK74_9HEMI|nr:unnamed protein product [Macrosiphum euphorbiae]